VSFRSVPDRVSRPAWRPAPVPATGPGRRRLRSASPPAAAPAAATPPSARSYRRRWLLAATAVAAATVAAAPVGRRSAPPRDSDDPALAKWTRVVDRAADDVPVAALLGRDAHPAVDDLCREEGLAPEDLRRAVRAALRPDDDEDRRRVELLHEALASLPSADDLETPRWEGAAHEEPEGSRAAALAAGRRLLQRLRARPVQLPEPP